MEQEEDQIGKIENKQNIIIDLKLFSYFIFNSFK